TRRDLEGGTCASRGSDPSGRALGFASRGAAPRASGTLTRRTKVVDSLDLPLRPIVGGVINHAGTWIPRPAVARGLVVAGRGLFGVALVGLGIEHVVFGEFVTGRAPAWPSSMPGGVQWAHVSGAILIATGL